MNERTAVWFVDVHISLQVYPRYDVETPTFEKRCDHAPHVLN